MTRYIDTVNKTEYIHRGGELLKGVVAAIDSHPFFSPLPENHKVVWNEIGILPDIVPLSNDEITAIESIKADQAWKDQRAFAVSQITVIVDGMVFDGDEISQDRMARAIAAADTMSDTTDWRLHDNTVQTVTASQLKTALRLAGEEQTTLWMP